MRSRPEPASPAIPCSGARPPEQTVYTGVHPRPGALSDRPPGGSGHVAPRLTNRRCATARGWSPNGTRPGLSRARRAKPALCSRWTRSKASSNPRSAPTRGAAAAGECTLQHWRDRNREVDFVVERGHRLIAIEIKSGRRRDTLPGLEAFAMAFKPRRNVACRGGWRVGGGFLVPAGWPLDRRVGQHERSAISCAAPRDVRGTGGESLR